LYGESRANAVENLRDALRIAVATRWARPPDPRVMRLVDEACRRHGLPRIEVEGRRLGGTVAHRIRRRMERHPARSVLAANQARLVATHEQVPDAFVAPVEALREGAREADFVSVTQRSRRRTMSQDRRRRRRSVGPRCREC